MGATAPLTFRVFADGARSPLERYLGAYGHLVALREGDLGYLHVHPEDRAGGGRQVLGPVPSPGRYRIYLDFQVSGVVRTAEFTMVVD